jgi:5-methylcytosine-specific restriction endonuclease McrA
MAKSIERGNSNKLDAIVAQARQLREQREQDYRAKALKMYPWVCGRCAREFARENLRELTVHHRDHNHDNNPEDGSNWELLCVYCHDNEHARYIDFVRGEGYETPSKTDDEAVHRPFADLASLLKKPDPD